MTNDKLKTEFYFYFLNKDFSFSPQVIELKFLCACSWGSSQNSDLGLSFDFI